MDKKTKPRQRSRRRRRLVGIALAFLLAGVAIWLRSPEDRKPRSDTSASVIAAPQSRGLLSAGKTAAPALSQVQSASRAASEPIDEQTMLSALKSWIRRRENREVQIVESRRVCDLEGRPVSLNVLVTSLPGGLSSEELRARLAASLQQETGIRKLLAEAKQRKDVSTVNRVAAEFAAARADFLKTNQVSTYKVSLSRQQPPVLAYWEGITYECAREVEARDLAARSLGDTAKLQGLVAYTSVASLLCFTNQTGSRVYVDPVNLTAVSSDLVARIRPVPRSADKGNGRESRIADQWSEVIGSLTSMPR